MTSLDGFIADESGNFDWAVPDEEVHAFINDLERNCGTHLYGRRTYEMMTGWETDHPKDDDSDASRDFAEIWQAADKIVYSRSLERVTTARTTLEREFDPEAVQRLKETTDHDLLIGGPGLAAHAVRAGLVDVWQLFVVPVLVGGGKRHFPEGFATPLVLRQERRFDNGMVFLRHHTAPPSSPPSSSPASKSHMGQMGVSMEPGPGSRTP